MTRNEWEQRLGYSLTEEKYQELENLLIEPLGKVRKDLTGQRIKMLYILGKAGTYISPGGSHDVWWWAICDCEKHTIKKYLRSNLLREKHGTISCGCWDLKVSTDRIKEQGLKRAANLTEKRFGKLVAKEPTERRNTGSIVWKCQCDCGNIAYVSASTLNSLHTCSCGCLNASKGELKIRQLLEEAKIPFEQQKSFKDCLLPVTNARGYFDFWVNNEFLLEYDGEQHFKEIPKFKNSLAERQWNDRTKNQYCKEHNIPLKRIPYTDLSKFTLEDIMGDKYLI